VHSLSVSAPVRCEAGPVISLADEEVRALAEPGVFVRDGFLGRAGALGALEHARSLWQEGQLRPAGIRRDKAQDLSVRNDEIAWLDPAIGAALGQLAGAFADLRDGLNRDAWLGLGRFDLQLARYAGTGARYVRHRDAFPGGENRRVTAILYLNPDWRLEHGGQLRLFTDPEREIEPLLDRLVVFLSDRVEHEVRPAFAERWAATAWYYPR
jgi:SM-20-related protein